MHFIPLKFKRILYTSISNIVRAPFVSFSAIFVMTVTLFVVGFSLLLGQLANDVITALRDKVDTTVYFVANTPESQIDDLRAKLKNLPEVKDVVYTSQDGALAEYKKRHADDPRLLDGLKILDANPFRARISIKAYDTAQYEKIAKYLNNTDILSKNTTTIIDKIDYYQNKDVIERLTNAINTTGLFANMVVILLIFISFLIVFNIIRLIIYLSRDEISVMKLIGADNEYVESPFLLSGAWYGLIGSVIAIAFLYPISVWLSPLVTRFFGGEAITVYYITNFMFLIVVLMGLGVFIGAFSSWLSTRKYL